MTTDESRLLTLNKSQLAKELGVSVRTLERLRRAGVLLPSLPGFWQPRWSTEAVRAWLVEQSKA